MASTISFNNETQLQLLLEWNTFVFSGSSSLVKLTKDLLKYTETHKVSEFKHDLLSLQLTYSAYSSVTYPNWQQAGEKIIINISFHQDPTPWIIASIGSAASAQVVASSRYFNLITYRNDLGSATPGHIIKCTTTRKASINMLVDR